MRATLPRTIVAERQRSAYRAFLKLMNETAKKLGLKGTNYSVAHGMYHEQNYSTAVDVAVLARHTLCKHELFRDVVNTKTFTCPSRLVNHTY